MASGFANKRVTVMGLGRFGGGVGVVRFLADQGARVLVTDRAPAEKLTDSLTQIQRLIDAGAVTLRLGGHELADFQSADVVVVNPAVPTSWNNRFIQAAVDAGARVTTEIRLLVERLPNRNRTIGVTGTAGKSTTAAMVAHILRTLADDGSDARPAGDKPPLPSGEGWGEGLGVAHSLQAQAHSSESCATADDGRDARPTDACSTDVCPAGVRPTDVRPAGACCADGVRVWLGGNIGGSLLPHVSEIAPRDWVVLELSSAQLYWLGDWFVGRRDEAGFSPHLAAVTNVTPNHLDWHETFEHYQRCKRNIVCFQDRSACDVFLEPDASHEKRRAHALGELPVVGAHNRRNAALAMDLARAALVSQGVDADNESLSRSLRTFTGLPHRLQLVAQACRGDGGAGVVRAFNDSKATTPEATALAVAAFEDDPAVGARRVHLIVGGYDKGVDLTLMIDPAARCRAVYTIGATGPSMAKAIQKKSAIAIECDDLASATRHALASVQPGEVILLSPGCASWDQFDNYEERGQRFTEQVRRGLGLPEPSVDMFEAPAMV